MGYDDYVGRSPQLQRRDVLFSARFDVTRQQYSRMRIGDFEYAGALVFIPLLLCARAEKLEMHLVPDPRLAPLARHCGRLQRRQASALTNFPDRQRALHSRRSAGVIRIRVTDHQQVDVPQADMVEIWNDRELAR